MSGRHRFELYQKKKKLSGIPITGRASYRIKPKKKTKNKELDYPLSRSLNSRGRTKQLQD